MHARSWRFGMALAMSVSAIACRGSGGGGFAVNARTVTPTGGGATSSGGLDLGAGIAVTRIRLAVQRIELEGGPAGGMGATDDRDRSHDDAVEVRVGPLGVDLSGDALSGGVQHVLAADVPSGTFRELRVDVGPVDAGEAGKDAVLAALAGRSVVIDGAIDGEPFTFESTLTTSQETEMTIQIGGSGGAGGVTLTIDPRGWFRAGDGMRLDPRRESDRAAIEDRLRSSIGAEREEGEDQGDDHGGDGSSGSGDDGGGTSEGGGNDGPGHG